MISKESKIHGLSNTKVDKGTYPVWLLVFFYFYFWRKLFAVAVQCPVKANADISNIYATCSIINKKNY